jgi:hypothetical protein
MKAKIMMNLLSYSPLKNTLGSSETFVYEWLINIDASSYVRR